MGKVRKSKSLNCKVCDEMVHNVGEQAEKVTCWKCVNRSMRGHISADEKIE